MIDLAQEIRILNTTADLIENAVNRLVCTFITNDSNETVEVKPNDLIEKKYFFILFLELISPVSSKLIPSKEDKDNLLTIIRKIGLSPILRNDITRSEDLTSNSQEFLDWLNKEISYNIYSANLGKNINLTITREEILYLVGNRCKHTLVRSDILIKKLAKRYNESGIETINGAENLILEDIDSWFFDDFCGYHFTKLCELCSNLYYSIIEYVKPEFDKRFVREGEVLYSYRIPSSLTRTDETSEFYELFNRARKIYIPKIRTPQILTSRY